MACKSSPFALERFIDAKMTSLLVIMVIRADRGETYYAKMGGAGGVHASSIIYAQNLD